jgi:thiamine kinase-like enzyme
MRVIKTNVLLLDTSKEQLIVKKFDRSKNVEIQIKLMKKLKDFGFNQVYEFYESLPFFKYNGELFVFLKYITPSNDYFHFKNFANREQGLKLLSNFHHYTKQILMENSSEFNLLKYEQIEKWEDRSREFKQNVPIIQKYTSLEAVQTYLQIGDFSIEGMKITNHIDKGDMAIIHGDVAYHNFIRNQLGTLYLIDFDLIAIAPPMIDYLQYANRILLHCHFDVEKLMLHKIIANQMKNPFFLYALLFPTDIYREWNRLIRENTFFSDKIHQMKSLTENQLEQRINFFFQIKTMIK